MRPLERRFLPSSAVRAIAPIQFSSSPGTLVGYACTYFRTSDDVGGFVERIVPGCFDKSLANRDDVRCLFNHSPNYPLGRVANGSLRLRSDNVGLHNECDLPDTSYARDLLTSIRRGDITDQSFAFQVEDDTWSDEDDPDNRGARRKVRTLRSAKLIDTSFVCFPAYPGTSVSAADSARSHSFDQLFPDGVPQEIRSRVGSDVRALYEGRRDRRRRLTNQVLSI